MFLFCFSSDLGIDVWEEECLKVGSDRPIWFEFDKKRYGVDGAIWLTL